MSKRHQATRRRSYGRRQHDLHQRTDLGSQLVPWGEGQDEGPGPYERYEGAFRFDRAELGERIAGWPSGDRD
jgi:hypothetical protein